MQLKNLIFLFMLLISHFISAQNVEKDKIILSEEETNFLSNYNKTKKEEIKKIVKIDSNSLITNNISSASPINIGSKKVDVDILLNYYQQEGNNSAITGGKGTEKLNTYEGTIVMGIPIDSMSRINSSFGIVNISAASFKKINTISAASQNDGVKNRSYGSINYQRLTAKKNKNLGASFHFSNELDMISLGGGFSIDFFSKDNDRNFGIGFDATFDKRTKIFFPTELINISNVKTSKRNTYSLSLSYSWILTKRIQVLLMGDFILQEGLLSIPFHRVYFSGGELKSEKLPTNRTKLPMAIRMNYYINDFLISRLYYRFYYDNFGIRANTISVEFPIKLGLFVRVYPFYRYHTQKSAKYFANFQEHRIEEQYYTSDHDLSSFYSQKLGVGIKILPLFGIFKFRKPFMDPGKPGMMKNIEIRYAKYFKNIEFESDFLTIKMSFEL